MANCQVDSISQQTLLTVDFPEVLGTDTFEYSLHQLLEREEIISEFVKQYKIAHCGRRAYPPSMLLRLVVFVFYRCITSSRVIASSCKTDLKFMVLAGGEAPHFTTIANFISSFPEAIVDVFVQPPDVGDRAGVRKH